MSAWSHLPNAAHIDRVLASVEEHPEIWSAAYTAAWDSARDETLDVAWGSVRSALSARDADRDASWDAAWESARNAVWGAVWNEVWDTARDAAWESARSAILALVAYDDCEKYLSIPSDQLRVWTILSENSAAVLLLPAVIAFERIDELEMV